MKISLFNQESFSSERPKSAFDSLQISWEELKEEVVSQDLDCLSISRHDLLIHDSDEMVHRPSPSRSAISMQYLSSSDQVCVSVRLHSKPWTPMQLLPTTSKVMQNTTAKSARKKVDYLLVGRDLFYINYEINNLNSYFN